MVSKKASQKLPLGLKLSFVGLILVFVRQYIFTNFLTDLPTVDAAHYFSDFENVLRVVSQAKNSPSEISSIVYTAFVIEIISICWGIASFLISIIDCIIRKHKKLSRVPTIWGIFLSIIVLGFTSALTMIQGVATISIMIVGGLVFLFFAVAPHFFFFR